MSVGEGGGRAMSALPAVTDLQDGDLIAVGQDGRSCRGTWHLFKQKILAAIPPAAKGDKGDAGEKGDRGEPGRDSVVPGPPGSPKRVQSFVSGRSDAAGLASVSFVPAFAAAPFVPPVLTWSGGQLSAAIPSRVTASGCELSLVRSKGTLALSAGPFEPAAGATATITAIGN